MKLPNFFRKAAPAEPAEPRAAARATLSLLDWRVHTPTCIFNPEHGCLTMQSEHRVSHLTNITEMNCSLGWSQVQEVHAKAFLRYIKRQGWIE